MDWDEGWNEVGQELAQEEGRVVGEDGVVDMSEAGKEGEASAASADKNRSEFRLGTQVKLTEDEGYVTMTSVTFPSVPTTHSPPHRQPMSAGGPASGPNPNPNPTATYDLAIRQARRHDSHGRNGLPFKGWGLMAWHLETVRLVTEDINPTSAKPRWAVDALVRLRDAGRCQVCGAAAWGTRGQVVSRFVKQVVAEEVPAWSESTTVLVCGECAKCWNASKNFYTCYERPEVGWCQQRLAVFRRRKSGFGGCRQLSATELAREHEVVDQLIRLEAELESRLAQGQEQAQSQPALVSQEPERGFHIG